MRGGGQPDDAARHARLPARRGHPRPRASRGQQQLPRADQARPRHHVQRPVHPGEPSCRLGVGPPPQGRLQLPPVAYEGAVPRAAGHRHTARHRDRHEIPLRPCDKTEDEDGLGHVPARMRARRCQVSAHGARARRRYSESGKALRDLLQMDRAGHGGVFQAGRRREGPPPACLALLRPRDHLECQVPDGLHQRYRQAALH
mmetsp:Transcript_51337/g.111679  ORF Transcript_51337/g.111679 Transcript_51337/m.111679 type:complete len:201 (+) Transcript_51337:1604-2206(+)